MALLAPANIGNRYALKLIDAGHDLHVYDIREEATANLREKGAKWAKGPAAVAKASEVIFSSLPSPAAVEHVVFDEKDGLLREMKQGKVYVDMSTSARGLARRIAEACEATGSHALDSPVTQGGVYATVGGDKEAFERCRPLFETISDHVYYVGEAGQGQVAKLVRQYVGFTSFITMAEAMTIAANAGADTSFIASLHQRDHARRGRVKRSDLAQRVRPGLWGAWDGYWRRWTSFPKTWSLPWSWRVKWAASRRPEQPPPTCSNGARPRAGAGCSTTQPFKFSRRWRMWSSGGR